VSKAIATAGCSLPGRGGGAAGEGGASAPHPPTEPNSVEVWYTAPRSGFVGEELSRIEAMERVGEELARIEAGLAAAGGGAAAAEQRARCSERCTQLCIALDGIRVGDDARLRDTRRALLRKCEELSTPPPPGTDILPSPCLKTRGGAAAAPGWLHHRAKACPENRDDDDCASEVSEAFSDLLASQTARACPAAPSSSSRSTTTPAQEALSAVLAASRPRPANPAVRPRGASRAPAAGPGSTAGSSVSELGSAAGSEF